MKNGNSYRPGGKSATTNSRGKWRLTIGFLYATSYAIYLASYLGMIVLVYFSILSFSNTEEFIQFDQIFLHYFLPITLFGVLTGYLISIWIDSKISLLAAIITFFYFMYFLVVQHRNLAYNSQSMYIAYMIFWMSIMIITGRTVYNTQAGAIKGACRKQKRKFNSSVFRKEYDPKLHPVKVLQTEKIDANTKLTIAILILFFILMIALMLENITVVGAFIASLLLFIVFQSRAISKNSYNIIISGFFLLSVFIVMSLSVFPFFGQHPIWIYMHGEIISVIYIIIVFLLLFTSIYELITNRKLIFLSKQMKKNEDERKTNYEVFKKQGYHLYKKYSKLVINKEIYYSVLFPIVLVVVLLSSITFGIASAGPNVTVSGLSPVSGARAQIQQPYGGYVFFQPEGTNFNVIINLTFSNSSRNENNPIVISNVSLIGSASSDLDLLNWSTSSGNGYIIIICNIAVNTSYFSGIVGININAYQS